MATSARTGSHRCLFWMVHLLRLVGGRLPKKRHGARPSFGVSVSRGVRLQLLGQPRLRSAAYGFRSRVHLAASARGVERSSQRWQHRGERWPPTGIWWCQACVSRRSWAVRLRSSQPTSNATVRSEELAPKAGWTWRVSVRDRRVARGQAICGCGNVVVSAGSSSPVGTSCPCHRAVVAARRRHPSGGRRHPAGSVEGAWSRQRGTFGRAVIPCSPAPLLVTVGSVRADVSALASGPLDNNAGNSGTPGRTTTTFAHVFR